MLSEAIAEFLEVKRAEGLAVRSLRWYGDQLARLATWLPGARLTAVRAVDLVGWLNSERDRGVAANTLDARWRAANVFFNWCELAREGFASPMGHGKRRLVARPRRGKSAINYVKLSELRRLCSSMRGDGWQEARDRALVRVLFWSGLRLSECAALDADDVDLRAGLVLVRHGKGDKARVVPLAPEVGPDILAYLYSRPLWTGPELWLAGNVDHTGGKGRLSAEGIRQMLMRRCRRAGLRPISPHAFRHGAAMVLLNNGLDMSAVSSVLGHSSQQITAEVYARWVTSGLQREYVAAYRNAIRGTDDS